MYSYRDDVARNLTPFVIKLAYSCNWELDQAAFADVIVTRVVYS